MLLREPELAPTLKAVGLWQAAVFAFLCVVWGVNDNFDITLNPPLTLATALAAFGSVAITSYRCRGNVRSWVVTQRFEAVALARLVIVLSILSALAPTAYMWLTAPATAHRLARSTEYLALGLTYTSLALLIVVTLARTERRFRLIGIPTLILMAIMAALRGQLLNLISSNGHDTPQWVRMIPPFELTHNIGDATWQLGILAGISAIALIIVYFRRGHLPRGPLPAN